MSSGESCSARQSVCSSRSSAQAMKIGIVGMPNAGKSTLFNALTAAGAVAHPEGRIDPVADAELVETELLAADLESAERRLERVTKQARSGDAEAIAEREWLEEVVEALSSGRPAREVAIPEAAPDALRQLASLTANPILYVVNVDEEETEPPPDLVAHAEGMKA